jgi:hypothetical protein
MSADILIEGQVCQPNISASGIRFRTRVGYAGATIAAGLLGASLALHWPWYLRAVVFLPVAISSFGFLQVRNRTCVARAREGTFEHEDMSVKTKADDAEVAVSRKMAAIITRNVLLIATGVAVLSAATALIG